MAKTGTKKKSLLRVCLAHDAAEAQARYRRLFRPSTGIALVEQIRGGKGFAEAVAAAEPQAILIDADLTRNETAPVIRALKARTAAPVVCVGAVTRLGPEPLLAALSAGAAEFVPKPVPDGPGERLPDIVPGEVALAMRAAVRSAAAQLVPPGRPSTRPAEQVAALAQGVRAEAGPNGKAGRENEVGVKAPSSCGSGVVPRRTAPGRHLLVVVGVAMGGPATLQRIVPFLPADFPAALLIVQHMPAQFAGALAGRLSQSSAIPVREASTGAACQPGQALFAPGGRHCLVDAKGAIRLVEPEEECRFVPTLDLTFYSALAAFGSDVVGLLLTGQGQDGVLGLRAVTRAGGRTLAQEKGGDEVSGMVGTASDLGCVQQTVRLENLAAALVEVVKSDDRPRRR